MRPDTRNVSLVCAVTLGYLLCFPPVQAETTGTLTGTVTSPDGTPAPDAHVVITELNRHVWVDELGSYVLEGIPLGKYHLHVESPRFGSTVTEVEIAGGENRVNVRLERSRHREKIVVTATRSGRGSAEVVQPVTVLDQSDLDEKLQPTIGETLANEPGVSSSYYAPGSSRPIIRGQGGGRIRVLEGGLGTGDASSTSPDHAVSTDALSAERVEILRGPATLLYGNSAVGGVVNVLDNRVPDHLPKKAVGGTVHLRLSSVADERSGAVTLDGGAGQVAWHLDGLARKTDDYDIPGNAVAGDPDSPSGTLPNSAVESDGLTGGISWVGKSAFVGVSARSYGTQYGVPADLEEEDEAGRGAAVPGQTAGVRIDLDQRRLDLRGGADLARGFARGITYRIGLTEYEHRELEGDEVGTRFFTDAAEGRVELTHGRRGPLEGVLGVQLAERDVEAVGAEAFLPPSATESAALFALEEIESGSMRYELGLRYESTDVATSATMAADPGRCADPRDRKFDDLSGSFGVAWLPGERYALGVSVARAVRPPSAEELYSCGEHVATLSFEVGDPDLSTETSHGIDLSLRKRAGRLTGEINLFTNRFDDYIYAIDTGATEPPLDPDGLPVFRLIQADAEFRGVEVQALVELYHSDDHDLDLELRGDYVRAELRDSGDPLPRIPPLRLGAGLRYSGTHWHADAELVRHDEQDRVAAFETVTAGYTFLNAAVGYRIYGSGMVHHLMLRGSNLTDEEARNHPSRLKDLVPLPGRDLSLTYRLVF